MNLPQVVSETEWQAAQEGLRAEEKEATRARDALAAKRRRLPMVRIDNDYVFDGPDGKASLLDLFEGRGQLLDRTPKGRGDDPEGWPRRHDEYE